MTAGAEAAQALPGHEGEREPAEKPRSLSSDLGRKTGEERVAVRSSQLQGQVSAESSSSLPE